MATKAYLKKSIPISRRGFFRLKQIIGDPKNNIEPLLPISKSGFYAGIKAGKYPAPIKLSPRVSVWRVEDIMQLLVDIASEQVD